MSARAWKRRRNKAVIKWLNFCAAKLLAEGVCGPYRLAAPRLGVSSDVYGESPGQHALDDALALQRIEYLLRRP